MTSSVYIIARLLKYLACNGAVFWSFLGFDLIWLISENRMSLKDEREGIAESTISDNIGFEGFVQNSLKTTKLLSESVYHL